MMGKLDYTVVLSDLRSDSRLKAISHIKALCADAKNKVIVELTYLVRRINGHQFG